MNKAFLMWQDNETRQWFTVGRLSYDQSGYTFVYTKGAQKSSQFVPFARMDNLQQVYKSEELFPLFANRLLPNSRPEYGDFVKWMGLKDKDAHPLALLARAEGRRETDNLIVHACPEKDDTGRYTAYFFCHGLRYLPKSGEDEIRRVKQGDTLYPMHDVQNIHDSEAVALRTNDPVQMVGYCPRYLTKDVKSLLKESNAKFEIKVEQVNADAPAQFRILCRASSHWPQNFTSCSDEEYQPLVS